MADIEVREAGSTVKATAGDRVVVRLPENATTGYQWSVAELGDGLEVESSELVLPTDVKPGAAGERVVSVRLGQTGRTRLVLHLKRQWESEPLERFHVDVEGGES
jgi:inhibitor of cysteine peptidase